MPEYNNTLDMNHYALYFWLLFILSRSNVAVQRTYKDEHKRIIRTGSDISGDRCRTAIRFRKVFGRLIIIIIIIIMLIITGNKRETSFLFQRLSVCIQRFNHIAFKGTFLTTEDEV